MTLNESIIKIRVELQNSKINKSGKNKHAGFEYYELSDFLPKLNELMLEHGINDKVSIKDNNATITLIKGEDREEYCIPFMQFETPLTKNGSKMMQDIQYLGALNTYYKRYLYLNAFGITDGEVIDSLNNNDTVKYVETSLGRMTEQETIQKAQEDGKAKLIKALEKPENIPYKDIVIKNVCDIIGNSWETIEFKGNLTYKKLVDIVNQELQKEKDLAQAGI